MGTNPINYCRMANRFRLPNNIYVQKYIHIEIKKVDVFRKVLNKQFIDRLRSIFIINKTQLQTSTDCFTPWGDHQGDLNQHNKTLKTVLTLSRVSQN